uniref:Tetratricopeptide repeat protein n=1 Tax=Desulfatirhabdium butyrativorans TaxID=340467 RepID=A0A7C4MS99_9BACT
MKTMPKTVFLGGILVLLWSWSVWGQAPSNPAPSKTIDPAYLLQKHETESDRIPDWQARWELARILSYVKQYPESLREYERVLSERPDLWEAKVEMAHVLHWAGQSKKALDLLETTTEDQRDEATRLLMAELYVMQKAYPKAISIYRQYIESHPQDVRIRAKLADVYGWSGQYDSAIAQYKTALSQRPDDIQLRRRYAFVLIWSKRYDEAIVELRKTLPPEPASRNKPE